jgi:hypothetical protein
MGFLENRIVGVRKILNWGLSGDFDFSKPKPPSGREVARPQGRDGRSMREEAVLEDVILTF